MTEAQVASHQILVRVLVRERIDGKDFAVVRYSDRISLTYCTRHMIDGRPVKAAHWQREKAAADKAATEAGQ
jgi:hypothetical protein